jgi:hypothetical protein
MLPRYLILMLTLLLCALPAATQNSERDFGAVQVYKLLPDTGAPNDQFGFALALADGIALVGARNSRTAGTASGAAFVYDLQTGQQIRRFSPDDGGADDWFGAALALEGNIALIGAPLHGVGGAAYVFDLNSGAQVAKLTPADLSPGDGFGWSVALSGSRALVGAPSNDSNGTDSGAAYVFDLATGDELRTLTPQDGDVGDAFGWAVALSGDNAAVGALYDDVDGPNSGSAYLFNVTNGVQRLKLTPLGTANTAAEATAEAQPGIATPGASAGEAIPFDPIPLEPEATAEAAPTTTPTASPTPAPFTSSDADADDDQFGSALALSGANLLVGSPNDDDGGIDAGAAYVFDVTTGTRLFKLTASNSSAQDRFGWSLALSGRVALISAAFEDGVAGNDTGSTYVFDMASGEQLARLRADDAAAGAAFGFSVGLAGEQALVGAVSASDNGERSGAAYVYDLALLLVPIPTVNPGS